MRFCFTIFIVFIGLLSKAQVVDPCFFDKYQRMNKNYVSNAEIEIQREIKKIKDKTGNVKIIPVVVHVIHDGGTSNISDAQIQSQIDVLNEDFRKMIGTLGYGDGVDTEIEFCLAKKNPIGKCTNGIVRINSSLSNHQTYQRSLLKDLSSWDNLRYLNIYVVKNINNGSGTLGYSSFPGGPDNEDGIVVRHDFFGKVGTALGSLGRTTTHEIGHWFGLYHTFNGGCGTDICTDGDLVCDTPPAANPNFGCPTINSCSIDSPDVIDQIQNYMDYSDDNCKSMFSDGQKQRMIATLTSFRSDIWQSWNLDSTGCDSTFVSNNCNSISDFVTLEPNICVGNTITFYNKSQNNPESFQWFFEGGSPSSSILENPIVTYSTLGSFQVKLITTNSVGTDSLIVLNYINVTIPPIGQMLPYSEDFESYSFPTNGIIVDNPDGGITWERDTIAIAYQGEASTKINNLINTNYGQSDALILPSFDFTSFLGTPYLKFKWAYARSDANYSDELIVLVSNDCGVNWTQKFYKTGSAMSTGITQVTPYIPDTTTVWKSASINLNTYSSFQNVMIKIVNVTDGGNNLYIDNITLGDINAEIKEKELIMDDLLVYPNPTNGNFSIQYSLINNDDVHIVIKDFLGREVYNLPVEEGKIGLNKSEVSTELKSGVYTVVLKTTKGLSTEKVVKN